MSQTITQEAGHRGSTSPDGRVASRIWGAGGEAYDAISRQIADAIEHAVDRLDPKPGERILDVGTGTGWAARRIAARGASVSAVDPAEGLLNAARHLDESGAIDFRSGAGETLPFPDASFDGVISTFGVMFCQDPERSAAELSRVCKPGGRVVLATWKPEGSVRDMFELIQSHKPAGPAPKHSPFAWGETPRLVELFGDAFDLGFEEATSWYRADDGAAAWTAFSSGFGPVVSILEAIEEEESLRFKRAFTNFYESFRTGAGILTPREYVLTVGRRRKATS